MNNKINEGIKTKILEEVKRGEKTIADLGVENSISSKTIYRWIKEAGETSPSYWTLRKLKQENRALKELIGAITLEMEKGKKKGSF